MPSDQPAARVYGFVARDVSKAVLLRRGPSKQVRLLSWDLETDRIVPGQWLKGRIYERRCDLSPDGNLFVYFAAKHRGPVAAWTAVCRPPTLTALSFFPKDDCWGGGGLFADGRTLSLNHRFDKPADVQAKAMPGTRGRKVPRYMQAMSLRPWEEPGMAGVPKGRPDAPLPRNALNLRVLPLGEHSGFGEDNPIEDLRLRRDGWTIAQTASVSTHNRHARPGECSWQFDPPVMRWKQLGASPLRLQVFLHGIHENQGRWIVETMAVTGPSGALREFGRVDWAEADHNGDVLYAADGCLYRLAARENQGAITGEARLVADLTGMAFEEVVNPATLPPVP